LFNALDEILKIFFEKSAGVAELHRVFLRKIFLKGRQMIKLDGIN
jgi:hypothetical protein